MLSDLVHPQCQTPELRDIPPCEILQTLLKLSLQPQLEMFIFNTQLDLYFRREMFLEDNQTLQDNPKVGYLSLSGVGTEGQEMMASVNKGFLFGEAEGVGVMEGL